MLIMYNIDTENLQVAKVYIKVLASLSKFLNFCLKKMQNEKGTINTLIAPKARWNGISTKPNPRNT